MFIYRIYNTQTNESYIGQTKKTVDYRFKEHIREANRSFRGEQQDFPLFHRMLLYYGISNFKVETLEEVPDDKGDEREVYWIKYYNSYYEGYNSTKGGQNRSTAELMKENVKKWKIKDSNAHMGGMSIQEVINNGLYNPIGNINAGKSVAQYTLDGALIKIYPAATIASKETGIGAQNIRNTCNGKTKKSGGFIWKWIS